MSTVIDGTGPFIGVTENLASQFLDGFDGKRIETARRHNQARHETQQKKYKQKKCFSCRLDKKHIPNSYLMKLINCINK
ncbi:MAG: hypothetical protein J6Y60_02190 [Treponema sp.]|nr:hypothetical protein [Treponema sp.]